MRKPLVVGLFFVLAGCQSGQVETATERVQSAISTCGAKPKVSVCETTTCSDGVWEIDDLPAGTPCNSTGKCDGAGKCSAQPPPPPTPTPRVMDFTTAEITELPIDVIVGQQLDYETRNCTPGADPVLHILRAGATSDQLDQVAMDDNLGGGVNAHILTTPTTKGGQGFLVMRAKNDAFGRCDVWRNGVPWHDSLSVGGKTVNVVASADNAVETVAQPYGSVFQTLYMLSGQGITRKVRPGTGTGNSTRFVMSSSTTSFLVHGSGASRVIVNDETFDSDGDGLGDALEAALGTCATATQNVSGFACSNAKTPKDTDGDGLSDAWEVLGKRDQTPHQLLPFWGANPRHKDIFVEVDSLDDGDPATPAPKLTPDAARRAAAYWQDSVESLDAQTRATRAALLKNPDGRSGVSMHFDSGILPENADDAKLYGNWGGNSALPPGSNYQTVWTTALTPARRGLFHWMQAEPDAGQTAGFPSRVSAGNGDIVAHELGHTMGLEHYGLPASGALNCKPQYASPMNYGYAYKGVGFSDGGAPAPIKNTALTEFGYLLNVPQRARYADLLDRLFGYMIDRTTWSVDFNRDGHIAASGTTVRAFANNAPNGQCEGIRERRSFLPGFGATTSTPAVARLESHIVILTATGTSIVARVGGDTYQNCVGAGGDNGSNPCGTFGDGVRIALSGTAVDAVTVGNEVVFAFIDADGFLRTGHLRLLLGTPNVTIDPAPLSARAIGEPAMALQDSNTAVLVYADVTGLMNQVTFQSGAGWLAPGYAIGENGWPFHAFDAPGIVKGRLPGDAQDGMFMHVQHDVLGSKSSTLLKLRDDGKWAVTALPITAAKSRPGLAYVPDAAHPERGTLYALVTDANAGGILQMRMSTGVKRVNNILVPQSSFDFVSAFENNWTTAYGADLMFEPGHDTNLRAVVAYNFGPKDKMPSFEPLADGITDLTYGSTNDWAVIGTKACSSVANPGNLVSNPMPCL